MIRSLFALFTFLALVRPAEAHSLLPGAGAFYNGMLHPLAVPAQLLALVAAGLIVGQHVPASSRIAVPAFTLVLAGTLAVPAQVLPEWPPVVLLAAVFVSGTIVALSLDIGSYGSALLVAVIALLVGFAANHGTFADGMPRLALVGTAATAILVVVLLGGLTAWLRRPWQKIGVRVLGSWTAASAFLVIALSFAPATGVQ